VMGARDIRQHRNMGCDGSKGHQAAEKNGL
jgi:hypothetical protein